MADLLLGYVAKPHGIKGELVLTWLGETPPHKGMAINLHLKNGQEVHSSIAGLRWHKDQPLVFLEGLGDRADADKYRGAAIFVSRSQLPPLEEGEAYLHDLLGNRIYLPSGQYLGRIDHVEFPAGQEIWAILNEKGEEFLFPAQPEFIKDIDPSGRKVVIDPPSGLLEIYLKEYRD